MRKKDLENTEKRKNKILEAAETCFIAKGFHKTTLRDISNESGVSLGSIYQYFENKNAIILTFVERSNDETSEAIDYIAGAKNFTKALKEILNMMLNNFVKRKKLIIYLEILSEALKNDDIKAMIKREKTEIFFEVLLKEAERNDKIQLKLPAKSSSQLILSAVETAAANAMIYDEKNSMKEASIYIEEVVDLLFK